MHTQENSGDGFRNHLLFFSCWSRHMSRRGSKEIPVVTKMESEPVSSLVLYNSYAHDLRKLFKV
jgi:hypothetical protein